MADEWQDVAAPQQGHDEWQDIKQQPSMNLFQTAADTYGRAGMGAYDALKWIPGVKELANMTPGPSADTISKSLQDNANLGQKVVQGTGQALATLPQVLPFIKAAGAIPMLGKMAGGALNPITGLAGYGAMKAGAQGENPVQGAAEGAGQGLAYSAGGAAGSALSKMALNPLAKAFGGTIGQGIAKSAPAIGTSAGSAAASALISPTDKVSNAIVGGALGAMNPVGQENYNDVLQQAADAHQKMLNIGKGTIQKVEMKSGKDLNDSYKLAAQHGLTYSRFEGNKTDTSVAQQQIEPIMSVLQQHTDDIVNSDPHKLFDLKQLADDAKVALRKNPLFKNDLAYNNAKNQIDAHVDAAVANRGQFVDAPTLNTIKQGMWKASFEPLAPNNNAVARQMGNTAKDALEKAFPQSKLGEVNAQLGKYLDLKALLINAHGNIVPGGRLGKGWAGGIGAMTGIAGSHFAPNPEVAGLMTLGGTKAGMMVHEHLNDPATISKSWADKVKFAQMAHGINLNPQLPPVLRQYQQPSNPTQALGFDNVGAYGKQRMAENDLRGIPNQAYNGGMPINQPPNPGAMALGQFGNPKNASIETPTGTAQSSNAIPLPGAIQKTTENLSINPKTSAADGPLQPNLRAQFDMSKGGNSMVPKGQKPKIKANKEGSKQGDIQDPNTFNPLAKTVSPDNVDKKVNPGIKALGMAGAIGLGSMFNPLNNAQAAQIKEPERLQLQGDQYTKKEEGFQAHPYIDTTGNKTIGYGFKMDAVGQMLPRLVREGKAPLTKEVADKLYTKLYSRAMSSARDFAGDQWHSLNGQQQKALTDMSYNMGGKLNGFVNLKNALQEGNFDNASAQIMNSRYAKQAPNRAMRNAALIKG